MALTRRDFVKTIAGMIGTGALGAKAHASQRPPNVVLILIDDLGWRDLGCYGGAEFETPRIDRLAREGMRFTNAYSNCPVCSPSRAALLTGKNPARLQFTGHITAIERHRHPDGSRILPPDDLMHIPLEEVTLAEALKPAGYVSASIGKWHVGGEGFWPEDQGFDENIGGWTHGSPPSYFYPYKNPDKDWNPSIPTLHGGKPGEYLTDRLTDESIRFIETHRDKPFFLYLTHYAVHFPLQAPKELVQKYERKLAGKNSGIDPTYAAMVENMDSNTGRVLDTLDRLGLTENTVVIFYSDNGGEGDATNNSPLRRDKSWLYEGGIRVPLIVKWPGRVEAGTVCHEPVIGSDLYPTISELAGEEARQGEPLDGVSLVPLLEGADRLNRDALYWYYPHYPKSKEPGAAIRKRNYKLIDFYDPPRMELYNLANDLSEQHNLVERMPEKAQSLRAELYRFLERVDAKMHTLNPNR